MTARKSKIIIIVHYTRQAIIHCTFYTALSLYLASVVGGFVGVLVMAGTALLLACFCRYQSKQKSKSYN